MRTIETKIERPKAPSQTLKVKYNINIYIPIKLAFTILNINKNKIITIISKLNKVESKCLWLETKEIQELKKIIPNKIYQWFKNTKFI